MEVKGLLSLALYAVGLAMAALVFALNILGTFPVSTLAIFLSIGLLSISVAGISPMSRKK